MVEPQDYNKGWSFRFDGGQRTGTARIEIDGRWLLSLGEQWPFDHDAIRLKLTRDPSMPDSANNEENT